MDAMTTLSNTSQEHTPEVTAHHEAGHAVMARLIGRKVFKASLTLNEEQSYNGKVCWDREVTTPRDWGDGIPPGGLGLTQEDRIDGAALVFAAGKAAERIWYRQKGLDESFASYGKGRPNDEDELEAELKLMLATYPLRTQLSQEIHRVEECTVQLLAFPICWQAVEAVAQELLERLKQNRQGCVFEEAQACIAGVFARAKTM